MMGYPGLVRICLHNISWRRRVRHVSTIHGSSRSVFCFLGAQGPSLFLCLGVHGPFLFVGSSKSFLVIFVFGSSRSRVSRFRACKLRFVNLDFARDLKRGRRGVQPIEGINSWRAKGTLRPLNVRPPKH